MINELTRIQKLISNYGSYSRRETEKLIKSQRVKLNGRLATLGDKATINDRIEIDGKKITFNLKHQYFLLNKPKGYICSRVDKENRTAISLINNYKNLNLFTVGRLDVLTTGLIIVTNDGELSNYVLSPSSAISKTYLVWIDRKLTKEEINKLKFGILLDNNYKTKPLKDFKYIENLKKDNKNFLYKISITEGKNNQIRRMFKALDLEVINLKRIAIGNLHLEGIESKKYKTMKQEQIYSALGYKSKNK